MLSVNQLTFKVKKKTLIDELTLNVTPGSFYALLGRKGSGKTTLLRCLNFLEMPDNGVIRVNNRSCLIQTSRKPSRNQRCARRDCILDWCSSHLIFSRSTRHFRT